MPYLNKRNRFIQAAKSYAQGNNVSNGQFSKSDLQTISESINMKGIPTWVLKDCKTAQKGVYDLSGLFNATTATV